MKMRASLKNFFEPSWKKIILMFVLEFCITLVLLLFGTETPWWAYLLSPNIIYLEATINFLSATLMDLAFHGAVSNIIDLAYIYFLSCVIIRVLGIGKAK